METCVLSQYPYQYGHQAGEAGFSEIQKNILCIILQLETSSLAVVRFSVLNSNMEALLRGDMSLPILSRLIDILANELIVSSDVPLRSTSCEIFVKKMEQIFGRDNNFDPSPILSALELHLHACADNYVRADVLRVLIDLANFMIEPIIERVSLVKFLLSHLSSLTKLQLSQSAGLTGFHAIKSLQLNRDTFFQNMFSIVIADGLAIPMLDEAHDCLFQELFDEMAHWECKDFDADLKLSSFCLVIPLCLYSVKQTNDKKIKDLLSKDSFCSTLKKYILGRAKLDKVRKIFSFYVHPATHDMTEQERGLRLLHMLVLNTEKAEFHVLIHKEFPTLILECLKPKVDNVEIILEVFRAFVNRSTASHFNGRNPLDSIFDVGSTSFFNFGKWCSESGNSELLIEWYGIFEDVLSSTIEILDLNASSEALSYGLAASYSPEILHAAWNCMIRFCVEDRLKACPSFSKALLASCSLLSMSYTEQDIASSIFLHENALFVFLNCLNYVFAHGWQFMTTDDRQSLISTFESDVVQGILAAFEVIPDRTIAAFYDVLCSALENSHSYRDLSEWALAWCSKVSAAGFFSTLLQGLGDVSITASVSKTSARLLFNILLQLGFIGPSYRIHFDRMKFCAIETLMERVMDDFSRQAWASSGVFVVSAILAGSYHFEYFNRGDHYRARQWLTFVLENFYLLREEVGQEDENGLMKASLARHVLLIEKSIWEAYPEVDKMLDISSDEIVMLLVVCNNFNILDKEIIVWLLKACSDEGVCEQTLKLLFKSSSTESHKFSDCTVSLVEIIDSNEKCAPILLNMLDEDHSLSLYVMNNLQTSTGNNGVNALIREGLLDRLNRIILADPNELVVETSIKTLRQLIDHHTYAIQMKPEALRSLWHKLLAIATTSLEDPFDGKDRLSNLALGTMVSYVLNVAKTEDCVKFYSQGQLSMVCGALHLDSTMIQGCVLALSIALKVCQSVVKCHASELLQHLFASQNLQVFLKTVQKMLVSEISDGRLASYLCTSMLVLLPWKELETKSCSEYQLLLFDIVHGAIVGIQNSLMDPLLTIPRKCLAISCLEVILSSSYGDAYLSLEWFRVLAEKAIHEIASQDADATIHWIFYLKVMLTKGNESIMEIFFSENSMLALQRLTLTCSMESEEVGLILSLWDYVFRRQKISILRKECREELKHHFIMIFNEFSNAQNFIDIRMNEISSDARSEHERDYFEESAFSAKTLSSLQITLKALISDTQGEKNILKQIIELKRNFDELQSDGIQDDSHAARESASSLPSKDAEIYR